MGYELGKSVLRGDFNSEIENVSCQLLKTDPFMGPRKKKADVHLRRGPGPLYFYQIS